MHIVSSGVSGALISESSARPLSLVLLIGLASAAVHSPFQPGRCRHHSPGLSLLRPHQSALPPLRPPCAASGPGVPGARPKLSPKSRSSPRARGPRSPKCDPRSPTCPAGDFTSQAGITSGSGWAFSFSEGPLLRFFRMVCSSRPRAGGGRRGRRGPGTPSMPLPVPVVPKPDPATPRSRFPSRAGFPSTSTSHL